MAKEYKRGEKYYLPVTISSIAPGYQYPIELMFDDCDERDTTDTVRIADEPDLLLTAEDIAMVINTERDDALAELKSRNAELEALLKEVMATRDEAIRQNDELIAENKKLKDGADKLKDTLVDRTKDVQHLTEENEKLKADLDQRNKDFWAMKKDRDELDSIGGKLRAENENLKAWYEEANKTASEAAEANDELKMKIAQLKEENDNLRQELKKRLTGYVRQSDYAELSKAYVDKCSELEAFKAEHDKAVIDLEEARDGAIDESFERKNRVTTMEEVIVALVEKIRRLEGGDD